MQDKVTGCYVPYCFSRCPMVSKNPSLCNLYSNVYMKMLIKNNTVREMLKKITDEMNVANCLIRSDGEYSRLHNKNHTKKEEPLIKYLQK